ncbi:MAG: acyl-CoA dehydratase activase [Evtepia sp.]|uniref:acyl-CoA dehydratase activase n=1 Tax=Evtepia sp. TaxID=2773933 RepID=UPI002A75B4FF|nr:acyl-CoA dehydratase activase [Evtepia sp.]MDY3013636.1 acyl-CoA dehydratase activase [Evtepia sp.]
MVYLGLDIGSSSSKAVLLDEDGQMIAAQVVNLGTGTRGPGQALEAAYAQANCKPERVRYTVVTGYGRMTFQKADRQITEISCHAKGVRHLSSQARTIIDVGGQDTKAIRLDAMGGVENFVMNDKCAAGTGRFLEVMSRVLDCPIQALSDLAQQGKDPVSISNLCTVFAESEVISHLSTGASQANVAAGAIDSIATRIVGMAGRVGGVPQVVMTGGGALNGALVKALSHHLGCPVQVLGNPQVMGALGAAAFAREMAKKE